MAPPGEDEQLRAIAARLEFREASCRLCSAASDAECANCGGSGRVWQAGRGLSTLSDEGLVRFAKAKGLLS